MKRSITLLFVSLVALMISSSTLEARITKEAQSKETITSNKVAAPTIYKKQVAPTIKCINCESDEPLKPCAEKVNTVVYRDSCGNQCGFPVSVRVPTNCKGSM